MSDPGEFGCVLRVPLSAALIVCRVAAVCESVCLCAHTCAKVGMRVFVWVRMCVFPSAAGVSVGRGSYLLRPAAALLLRETSGACLDKRKDEQT